MLMLYLLSSKAINVVCRSGLLKLSLSSRVLTFHSACLRIFFYASSLLFHLILKWEQASANFFNPSIVRVCICICICVHNSRKLHASGLIKTGFPNYQRHSVSQASALPSRQHLVQTCWHSFLDAAAGRQIGLISQLLFTAAW